MKKRVAMKILKYKDRLRYKPSQIEEAMRVAARYGIKVDEGDTSRTSQDEQQPATEKTE